MGGLRFGQGAKGMIQGDFHGVTGAESERFSRGQFGLGVEALYHVAGELAFGGEPVEQQGPGGRAACGRPSYIGSILERIV